MGLTKAERGQDALYVVDPYNVDRGLEYEPRVSRAKRQDVGAMA